MATITSGFTPGHVLSYTPAQHHCREGQAWVDEHGVALDTYWRAEGDSESHRLTKDEAVTAKFVFNTADFDALDRYSPGVRQEWERYAPVDRARISSQHGLQEALFIRKGAAPHLGTQIENARAALTKAQAECISAEGTLKSRRLELCALEALAGQEG